jgi:hypothetical protein
MSFAVLVLTKLKLSLYLDPDLILKIISGKSKGFFSLKQEVT